MASTEASSNRWEFISSILETWGRRFRRGQETCAEREHVHSATRKMRVSPFFSVMVASGPGPNRWPLSKSTISSRLPVSIDQGAILGGVQHEVGTVGVHIAVLLV